MKRWVLYLVGVLSLWMIPIIPNERISIEQIEPIEVVYFSFENGCIISQTDTGSIGYGNTVGEALENMKQGAMGMLLLDTVDNIVFEGDYPYEVSEMPKYFRPATRIYRSDPIQDINKLAKYLKSHQGSASLGEYILGECPLGIVAMNEK